MKDSWPYVVLCLVVPLAWGVLSAHAFDRWQAWLKRNRPKPIVEDPDEPVDMYYI